MKRHAMAVLRAIGFLTTLTLLTALTQIGGVVLLVAWLVACLWRPRGKRGYATAGLFAALYTAASLWVVPPLATLGGRQALPCGLTEDGPVGPRSLFFCALNRHYATPRVGEVLAALADDLARSYPGIQVAYLDASFPFFDGFRMLPHRTHDDGRKVDLAFFYADGDGRPSAAVSPSPIGYWGYEQPRPGDPAPCSGDGQRWPARWDLTWLQTLLPDRTLHAEATAAMIRWLAGPGTQLGVQGLILEPHLQKRLGVEGGRVRFYGCRTARHDDHIHVSIWP